jgi:hypothetical protein
MTQLPKQFQEVVLRRIKQIIATLEQKSKDYAANGDLCANFKKIAAAESRTPEQSLLTLVLKHVISLTKFTHDVPCPVYSRWEEKIGDIITYMFLLDSLLQEQHTTKEMEHEHEPLNNPNIYRRPVCYGAFDVRLAIKRSCNTCEELASECDRETLKKGEDLEQERERKERSNESKRSARRRKKRVCAKGKPE